MKKNLFLHLDLKTLLAILLFFLRYFMPNQQGLIFDLIFSICFPRLIKIHILKKIKIIISDGDPQEYSQIDNDIYKYLLFAKHSHYVWHIIANSFEKNF